MSIDDIAVSIEEAANEQITRLKMAEASGNSNEALTWAEALDRTLSALAVARGIATDE